MRLRASQHPVRRATSASSSWLFEGGESEIALRPPARAPELASTSTHGGVCMTLLDVTMAPPRAAWRPETRRRHDRDEDQLHAALGAARCIAQAARCMHRTATMAFTEATIYDERRQRACAHATGTFKYVKRRLPTGARERQRHAPAVDRLIPFSRRQTMPTNKQIHLDYRPDGEAAASNFQLVDRRDPGARGRPGAGAPPLPEPRPVHARPHERREELRAAAAAGPGDAGRHGRRGGREQAPQVRSRATRSSASAAGRNTAWSTPRSPARCARSTPRTCRCRTTSARSACRASRPGTG